jgi:hypothetical protein
MFEMDFVKIYLEIVKENHYYMDSKSACIGESAIQGKALLSTKPFILIKLCTITVNICQKF